MGCLLSAPQGRAFGRHPLSFYPRFQQKILQTAHGAVFAPGIWYPAPLRSALRSEMHFCHVLPKLPSRRLTRRMSGVNTKQLKCPQSLALRLVAMLALLSASIPLPTPGQTASAKPAPKSSKSAAADLPLVDLDGYKQVLAKYRGKPLVVTFWATWCEPCRDEFPLLVELQKQYAPQGLAIFGVSLDDDADMNLVRRFLARNQPAFSNYRQKPGIDVDAFYRGVNPAWSGTMPETIFYGHDGRIIGHFVGAQSRASFEEGIRQVLASPGAQASGH